MEVQKLKRKKDKYLHDQNWDGLFFACKDLADIYFRDELYDEALREYKELLNLSMKNGKNIDIARAHRMVGEVLCAKQNFSEAIKHQQLHLNLSREENDLVEEQRALATLGRTFFLRSEASQTSEKRIDLNEATSYYLESLTVCDRLTDGFVGHKQVMEMRARLYLNLGLVCDSQGDYDSSVDYLNKAVSICKNLDLWEDLYRTYCSMASVHQHFGNSKESLLHYDLAISVACRLPDKVNLLCDLLPMKAEVLVDLPDFRGARQVLLKAYKLKSPNIVIKHQIEKKLRTVAAMLEAEQKLLKLQAGQDDERKKLYESIGDMASSLGSYDLALAYYQLMLSCVERAGGMGKILIDCYVSLAQTNLDNGDDGKACEFFKKQLALEKNNPSEACRTCLNIADCLERIEFWDEMTDYYNRAIAYAEKANDGKLRKTAHRSKYLSLKHCGMDASADEVLAQFGSSLIDSDDSDGEDVLEMALSSFGDHIIIDDLTDEDGCDSEELDRPKMTRTRQKSNVFKRNEKGETPLHTAAINGNRALVQKLLQQGHPVDVKDYSGWTPLHEACNHGYTEIAELLLDAGAHVNDRGGQMCDGVTPLLDAASNGCLSIMELLLEHGASPLMRTNKGESIVDCMQAWRERYINDVGSDLEINTRIYYDDLLNKMKKTLEKAGQKVSDVEKSPPESSRPSRSRRNELTELLSENRHKPNEDFINQGKCQSQKTPEKISTQRIRRQESVDYLSGLRKSLEDKRVSECRITDATVEYETAIKALRHRNRPNAVSSIAKIGGSGLLRPNEQVGDDWLEDDLRPSKKRRLHPSIGSMRKGPFIKDKNNFISPSSSPSLSPHGFEDEPTSPVQQVSEDSNDSDLVFFSKPAARKPPNDLEMPSTSGTSSNRLKVMNSTRRRQISLMASGVTREKVRKSSEREIQNSDEDSHSRSSEESAYAQSISGEAMPCQQTAASNSVITPSSFINPICVKVRIEEKAFLIAVPPANEALTVKWLRQKAVSRYHSLEGVEPAIRLATEDGALLDESDPISLVFSCKEVIGIVESWNVEQIGLRYQSTCSSLKTEAKKEVKTILEESVSSGEIVLKDMFLRPSSLEPCLRVLNHHNLLRALNLSGNNLGNQLFKVAADCIVKLPQLELLDLSCCNLTTPSLNILNQEIEKVKGLQRLQELYLGFNPFEESLRSLCCLLNLLPPLKTLSLPSIGLTAKEFRTPPNFTLETMEWLVLSENELGNDGIREILGRLDARSVRGLSLSRTGSCTISSIAMFLLDNHPPALAHLDLSYCPASDHDYQQLIRGLEVCPSLERLKLDGCVAMNESCVAAILNMPIDVSLTGIALSSNVDISSRLHSLTITTTSCSKQSSLTKVGPFGYQNLYFQEEL